MENRRTYGKAVINLGIAVIIGVLMVTVLPRCLSFFMPFLVGFLVSVLAAKPVKFLEEKLKIKRKAGTACVIICVLAMIVLALYFGGVFLTEQVKSLIDDLPELILQIKAEMNEINQNMTGIYQRLPLEVQQAWDSMWISVEQSLGTWIAGIGNPSFVKIGNMAKQLPSFFISIIKAFLSAYFFTAERNGMHNFFQDYMPMGVQKYWHMIREGMRSALGGYLKAQVKIEIFVYIILVVGLLILRVHSAVLIAAGIAVVDLLPVFGAGTILFPWALFAFLGKDYRMAVGLLIIWAVTQVFRQVIQPKIVGDMVGISPIPTLFLLFVGYKFGGIVGLIIAVPIGIIMLNMYQTGVFDTVINSIRILITGLNRYRRFTPEDLTLLKEEEKEVKKAEEKI